MANKTSVSAVFRYCSIIEAALKPGSIPVKVEPVKIPAPVKMPEPAKEPVKV